MEVTMVPAALRIKYLDSAFLVFALWVQLQSSFHKFGLAKQRQKRELDEQKESWLEGGSALV